MHKDIIQLLVQSALDGGKLSLKLMDNSQPTLKPDRSVLTRADMAVSQMLHQRIAGLLKTGRHLLIDEEDPAVGAYFKDDILDRAEFIWVLDPIDGTRCFANRMPFYGISIGILKDRKPWAGAVYFPPLDELFYSDGKTSYFVRRAGTPKPIRKEIVPVDQSITGQSVFFGSDRFFKVFQWDFALCQMMMPSCAVIDLCWPAIGKGAGSIFNASLWDMAGSWPIFHAAELDLRNLETGQVLDRLDLKMFSGKKNDEWRVKEYYILSSKRNFPIIHKAITWKE